MMTIIFQVILVSIVTIPFALIICELIGDTDDTRL